MAPAYPEALEEADRGAYGLTLADLPASRWLTTAPRTWPAWSFSRSSDPPPTEQRVGNGQAVVCSESGVWQRVDLARASTEVFVSPDYSDEAFVHPLLAVTALFNADAQSRLGFHGGAFLTSGGAWGLLGEREAGKSSALAWLAAHGVPIVTDDVIITDGRQVFSGPRCLDLREPAARHFNMGEALGTVGNRERWRVQLTEVDPEPDLAGWVSLEWGDQTRIDRLPAVAGFPLLNRQRALFIGQTHPAAWMDAVSRPILRFSRQRDWDSADTAMQRLLEAVDSPALSASIR